MRKNQRQERHIKLKIFRGSIFEKGNNELMEFFVRT